MKKAKAKAGTDDVCTYVSTKQEQFFTDSCTQAKRGTKSEDECKDALKEKNQGIGDYDLKSLNNSIVKINKSSSQGDVAKRWSDIGERWGTACKAGAGATYQNRFLGEIQNILGTGGTTGSTGSTIQGL